MLWRADFAEVGVFSIFNTIFKVDQAGKKWRRHSFSQVWRVDWQEIKNSRMCGMKLFFQKHVTHQLGSTTPFLFFVNWTLKWKTLNFETLFVRTESKIIQQRITEQNRFDLQREATCCFSGFTSKRLKQTGSAVKNGALRRLLCANQPQRGIPRPAYQVDRTYDGPTVYCRRSMTSKSFICGFDKKGGVGGWNLPRQA